MALAPPHRVHLHAQELPKKLTAYLEWCEVWGKAADPDEIGKGDRAEQNPPPLDGHSWATLDWYVEHVTGFAKEFGFLPEELRRLRMPETERTIFLAKLDVIHQALARIAREEAEE